MTKADATELKKQIKKVGNYSVYFASKTGELSVRVYSYINDKYDPEAEAMCIDELRNGIITDAEWIIKHRTYQGFIHDTCIIFS